MGFAKEQMMEEDAQGWSFTDDWVCTNCVDEPYLRAVLETHTQSEARCSFCEVVGAAPLDVLLGAFVAGLKTEHEDALESVSWDGREGGFPVGPEVGDV